MSINIYGVAMKNSLSDVCGTSDDIRKSADHDDRSRSNLSFAISNEDTMLHSYCQSPFAREYSCGSGLMSGSTNSAFACIVMIRSRE